MAFYLKYRPRTFSCLVGQYHTKKILQKALIEDQVSHAYLFSGSRGTGKTSLARILAKAINCLQRNDDGEPCDTCELCKAANDGRLVDIIEIDAASNRGIDEMRDLREKIQFTPTVGKAKIYIIDEVHMLTKEAFNAILKTLEEPPEHVFFILATTEEHKIPETISSRCQQFRFQRFGIEEITKRLKFIAEEENIKSDDEGLVLIARLANGGLRDAISLLDQLHSEGDVVYENIKESLGIVGYQFVDKFFQILLKKDVKEAFKIVEGLNRDGYDLEQFCLEFLQFLREKMHHAIDVDDNEHLFTIVHYIELFSKAKNDIKIAIYPQLPLEVTILKSVYSFENANKQTDEKKSSKQEFKGNIILKPTMGNDNKVKSENKESVSENEDIVKNKPIAKNYDNDITIADIKSQWPRVFEHIKTAFIKLSLKNAEPVKINHKEIVLAFKSRFHMKKINESKNKVEVMNAIEQVFKSPFGVFCKLKDIETDVDLGGDKTVKKDEKSKPNIQAMIDAVFKV